MAMSDVELTQQHLPHDVIKLSRQRARRMLELHKDTPTHVGGRGILGQREVHDKQILGRFGLTFRGLARIHADQASALQTERHARQLVCGGRYLARDTGMEFAAAFRSEEPTSELQSL